jgi:hypothetical protein
MSADICVSTVALGGVPVMRPNRRSACSVEPASAGANGCSAGSKAIATASVVRAPDLFERSNIAMNSLPASNCILATINQAAIIGTTARRA